ncbi:MAG: AAA family ATPase [Bacteroidales bacterium]|nr:AAA family ATPase [Bacteroidales bacterium]
MSTLDFKKNKYYRFLSIENYKCFKGNHHLNFSNEKEDVFQWTVIIGNNNTGKTTILRILAELEPIKVNIPIKDEDRFMFVPKGFRNIELRESEKSFIFNTSFDSFGWRFTSDSASIREVEKLKTNLIIGYGIKRKSSRKSISEKENNDNTLSLFNDNVELTNIEEWLLQLDYSIKNNSEKAKKQFLKVKKVLTSEVLPDIIDFRFVTDDNLDNYVLFRTDFGEVRYYELGYGYQVTLAWLADLMKKMFERYPDSKNPLHEPAIVLIDEIDLHLHPEWQRKIIHFVGNLFPNVQFIATTHSPLVVQSADDINVIVLQKSEDNIIVKQPEISTFKGWTVEEILSELMELGEKTKSDDYLKLMKEIEVAITKNDKQKAQKTYNELDKILHPDSVQRKLLKIQMTSLTKQDDKD